MTSQTESGAAVSGADPFADADNIFGKLKPVPGRFIDDDDGHLPEDETTDFRPARLQRSDTYDLELVTKDSRNAWYGMPPKEGNKGFPGIEWFVRRSGTMCRLVSEDDPYAMLLAYRIEDHLHGMHEELKGQFDLVTDLLDAPRSPGVSFKGVDLARFENEIVGFNPRNGYALAAATLVGLYDQVIMKGILCRDMFLIPRKRLTELRSRRNFRALTALLHSGLRVSGRATREDFLQGTANVARAVEGGGELPEFILDDDFKLNLMEVKQRT